MRKTVLILIVFVAAYSSIQLLIKRPIPTVEWSPAVTEISAADFDEKMDEATPWSVVMVWADWCQICKRMKPDYNAAAETYQDEVTFFHLNGEENPEWAEGYKVTGYPTVIIFHFGQELSRYSRYMPAEAIQNWVAHTSGISVPEVEDD